MLDQIVQRIIKIREQYRYTQEEVADHLGMSQSAYFRLESGKTKIKVEHLIKLAKIYEVTVNYFIDVQEEIGETTGNVLNESPAAYVSKPTESKKLMIELDLTSEEYAEILPILKRKFKSMN